MARKTTKILTKTTDSGITVILKENTVIKKYSTSCICMVCFSTREEAKREFSLFRQSKTRI